MNLSTTLKSGADTDDCSAPSKSSIEVLIVYDNERTRARALRTQAHLIKELGTSFRLHFTSWSFKSLWHPKMMQMATTAASKADIIIFSVLQGRDLPHMVKKWIEDWTPLRNGDQPTVLALLETFNPFAPRTSIARSFLGEAARRSGVDFISCASDRDREPSFTLSACPSDSQKQPC